MRDKIYDIVEGNSPLFISKLISWVILVAILGSSIAFVLESVPEYDQKYKKQFGQFEIFVVILFSIEYVTRFVLVRKRMNFVVQPLNIIDLLAILPFYVQLFIPVGVDLRIIRLIRIVRIFRLFKLAKYSDSFMITAKSLKASSALSLRAKSGWRYNCLIKCPKTEGNI